jgi:hypothetical protein
VHLRRPLYFIRTSARYAPKADGRAASVTGDRYEEAGGDRSVQDGWVSELEEGSGAPQSPLQLTVAGDRTTIMATAT